MEVKQDVGCGRSVRTDRDNDLKFKFQRPNALRYIVVTENDSLFGLDSTWEPAENRPQLLVNRCCVLTPCGTPPRQFDGP